MKKETVLAILCSIGYVTADIAGAVNADLEIKAMSAREFRGFTLNDGWVLEPALRLEVQAIELGVNGFFDLEDYNSVVEKNEFNEFDWHLAYRIPLDIMNVSLRYQEYHFPNGGSEWREVSARCEFDTPLRPDLFVAYGLDGAIDKNLYAEIGIKQPFVLAPDIDFALGARVAYQDPDSGESGLSHYKLTAAIGYKIAQVELAYIGQIDDDVLRDAYIDPELGMFLYGYDVQFVVAASLKYRF